jgi:hypothetical protein
MTHSDFAQQFTFEKNVIPVTIEFSRKLDTTEFWRWVNTIWKERDKRFGLWGHPLVLGRKVHIYGVETWSWTSTLIEFTCSYCIVCFIRTKKKVRERVISAFVENIDPGAKVWVGGIDSRIEEGHNGLTLEDLARQQGVKPVQDVVGGLRHGK